VLSSPTRLTTVLLFTAALVIVAVVGALVAGNQMSRVSPGCSKASTNGNCYKARQTCGRWRAQSHVTTCVKYGAQAHPTLKATSASSNSCVNPYSEALGGNELARLARFEGLG
jgi:hypothetical protein